MKNSLRRILALVAAMPLAIGGAASASVPTKSVADSAWAQALEQNTLEAYANFAMSFPDSPHAKAAYAKLSLGSGATAADVTIGGEAGEVAVNSPGFVPAFMVV